MDHMMTGLLYDRSQYMVESGLEGKSLQFMKEVELCWRKGPGKDKEKEQTINMGKIQSNLNFC